MKKQNGKAKKSSLKRKPTKTVLQTKVRTQSRRVPFAVSTVTKSSSSCSFHIRHRELVAALDSNASASYDLSVMDSITFPWLSQISTHFDQYRVHNLRFSAKSTLSASTNGAYVLSYDPNVSDTPPTVYEDILQMNFHTDGQVWEHLDLTIPRQQLDRSPGPFRFTHVNIGSDPLLRSAGRLCVSSKTSSQLTAFINLYVVYDVELINPQPVAPVAEVEPDLFPDVTLDNRSNDTSSDLGHVLSIAQAYQLQNRLPLDLIKLASTPDMALDIVSKLDSSFAYHPLEMRIKSPGSYMLEVSDIIGQVGGTTSEHLYGILNWTKSITNVVEEIVNYEPDYIPQDRTGAGGWPIHGLKLYFDVLANMIPNEWREASFCDFSSSPDWPSIAIGQLFKSNLSPSHLAFGSLAAYLGNRFLGVKLVKSPRHRSSSGLLPVSEPSQLQRLRGLSRRASSRTTTTE